jgi:hypothetical protein
MNTTMAMMPIQKAVVARIATFLMAKYEYYVTPILALKISE